MPAIARCPWRAGGQGARGEYACTRGTPDLAPCTATAPLLQNSNSVFSLKKKKKIPPGPSKGQWLSHDMLSSKLLSVMKTLPVPSAVTHC